MTTSTVDYWNTFFEHANLTKIHGEPTFESIQTLQCEIIVNALSVYSDLGGGAHGHLGLVLSPKNAHYILMQRMNDHNTPDS